MVFDEKIVRGGDDATIFPGIAQMRWANLAGDTPDYSSLTASNILTSTDGSRSLRSFAQLLKYRWPRRSSLSWTSQRWIESLSVSAAALSFRDFISAVRATLRPVPMHVCKPY